jgi:predicted phage terminase large subunit-like protein
LNLKETLRSDFDPRLLTFSEGRRQLTLNDPLLFAAVYAPHHLKEAHQGLEDITLCDFHLDLLSWATSWSQPVGKPKENRACFIAPRNSGKSTWIFTLLPLWAGAHGHRRFVAAFSDSETQAITHLHTFKQELDTNELLREDFPEFCEPRRAGLTKVGRALMNNRNQIQQANGFVFMSKGADSAALGMKVGAQRPDVLLFDDIEPGESNYSAYEAAKRKETLLSDLFPLNDWAVVGIVGTTTMPNSLIDQIRKVGAAREDYDGDPGLFRDFLDPEHRWVVDANIQPHYWPVLLEVDGVEQSLWPERWPMDFINANRHTRDFAKNMMNRPVSLDGGYWTDDDIEVDQPVGEWGNTILCVDPAVTTAKRSDYTGLAVVSRGPDKKIYVRHAEQVKMASDALKEKVEALVAQYNVGLVYVETNQGGDLWKQVFSGLSCKVRMMRNTTNKEVRIAQACDFYKKKQVLHTGFFPTLEEQMLAFPKVPHDDVVDAVASGVLYFKRNSGVRVGAAQITYQEV